MSHEMKLPLRRNGVHLIDKSDTIVLQGSGLNIALHKDNLDRAARAVNAHEDLVQAVHSLLAGRTEEACEFARTVLAKVSS